MFEKRKVKFISKLVGISEAIRLILVFLNLNFISLNSFILFSALCVFARQHIQTNMLPYTSCCIAVAVAKHQHE